MYNRCFVIHTFELLPIHNVERPPPPRKGFRSMLVNGTPCQWRAKLVCNGENSD